MESPDAILHLDGVLLRRGGRVILRDIDWTISPGQTWVMLGANGSGKTSLLQVICGYQPVTKGRIELLGKTFGRTDWRELRQRIGWVSASLQSRLPEDETALETVMSGPGAILGWTLGRDHASARDALAWMQHLGCGHLEDSRWAWLSQGERQRVLLARAWFARPDVLFLDEPCAGLDPVAREQFLDWLGAVLEPRDPDAAPPATVLVTHHVEEIIPRCDHVLVLREGTVLARGARAETLTDPILSAAYGRPCRLIQAGEPPSLRIDWLPER